MPHPLLWGAVRVASSTCFSDMKGQEPSRGTTTLGGSRHVLDMFVE